MTIYFSTNIPALRATNVLSQATAQVGKSSTRLATGQRINSGADDPTGFALREGLRTSISGLEALSGGFVNVQAKLNVAQTVYSNALLALHGDINDADSTGLAGALNEFIKAKSDNDEDAANVALDKATAYQAALLGAVGTKANGKLLISDDAASTPSNVVVGMDSTNTPITISYQLQTQKELGIEDLLKALDDFLVAPGGISVANATAALTAAEGAVGKLSTASGSIGGTSNAIGLIKSNYSAMNTALRDAEGQISNVDTALEGSRLSQNELLAQNAMNVISYSRQFAAFVAGGAFA
ncbi:hypothetical protein FACS189419_08520 [Planctomycetales bacterium]|nr:hypothetical protein FACS189419_08520 [Planctomycetales bacterium]